MSLFKPLCSVFLSVHINRTDTLQFNYNYFAYRTLVAGKL